jgi:hypothetical protein
LILNIPDWMEQKAPGAAEAARWIARDETLSESQQQRLARLTSNATKQAWLEPGRPRRKDQKRLSEDELKNAHFELMWEAFRSPDFQPIGQSEVDGEKVRLLQIGKAAKKLATEVWQVAHDRQVEAIYMTYRNRHRDNEAIASLPKYLHYMGATLVELANFFERAEPFYKPEGPVPPVGKPADQDAIKTTVIRKLALSCLNLFGTPLYSTVAILANASLDRNDIDRATVQGSLPRL